MKSDKRLDIINWLTNPKRTASEGIDLYKKYGRPDNILRNLARTTNVKYIIDVLDNELKRLAGIDPLASLKPVVQKVNQPASKKSASKAPFRAHETDSTTGHKYTDPFQKAKKLPVQLVPVYDKKKQLYIEVKQLQSHLVAIGDANTKLKSTSKTFKENLLKRKQLAKSILDHWTEIDNCWKQIHHFAETNSMLEFIPPAKQKPAIKTDTTDPMKLDKRYSTVRTYISKYRKDIAKNRDLLVTYTTELNQIADLLNSKLGEFSYKKYNFETFDAS